MLLQNKLSAIHMNTIDTVVTYLAKITKLRDPLVAIQTTVGDELVPIALNRLVPSWRPFGGLCSWDVVKFYEDIGGPYIGRDDIGALFNVARGVEEVALTRSTKKSKKEYSNPENKDFSKMKCLKHYWLGHYANECPEEKGKAKQKQVATSIVARVDEGSSQL